MTHTRAFPPLLLAALAAAAAAAPRGAAADFYTVTDLGALPGGTGTSSGAGLNAAGLAAGEGDSGGNAHAFKSSGGSPVDLGALPGGFNSYAAGVDGSGRVGGYGDYRDASNNLVFRAFRSTGGSLVNFGVGGIVDASGHAPISSVGTGISGGGTVVGYVSLADGSTLAFTADAANALHSLGTLGGHSSRALGIGSSGVAVGQAQTASGFSDGFRMGPGGMQDLGLLPGGTRSAAMGINGSGVAVGVADSFGTSTAVIAPADGTFQPLGAFSGGSTSATSINTKGAIVGSASGSSSSLAIYYASTAATPVDLNSRITDPSWTLTSAVSINDAGQIVGTGIHIVHGVAEERGFLLTPTTVPEPPSALLAALGLAALAAARRLRRG